jgi:hypothetical protein
LVYEFCDYQIIKAFTGLIAFQKIKTYAKTYAVLVF